MRIGMHDLRAPMVFHVRRRFGWWADAKLDCFEAVFLVECAPQSWLDVYATRDRAGLIEVGLGHWQLHALARVDEARLAYEQRAHLLCAARSL
jgi:hypothetical protein